MDDALIEANLPLVRSVAARFAGRAETEDLVQVGSIGLIKAARSFDPARGTRFSTYAFCMIAGEIRHFLRYSRRTDLLGGVFADSAPADDDTEEEALARAETAELMAGLDESERRLVELRFFRSLTQKETAIIMKVSQSCVSRNEKRILGKLRDGS